MNKATLLFSFFASLASLNAHSALVVRDLHTPGDGLITYDTVSQLEWLDVGQTFGLTYDDVTGALGAGGQFEGWSIATRPQAQDLYQQFGFGWSIDFRPTDPSFRASYEQLIGFFGGGFATQDAAQHYLVMFGDPFNPTNLGWIPYVDIYLPDGAPGGYFRVETSEQTPGSAGPALQAHLVREAPAVPLPPAAWLFASALGGLAASGYRRGRRRLVR